MSEKVLALMVDRFLQYSYPYATFCWHGGEPTLAGYRYFARAIELIEMSKRSGHIITHLLQTNATSLTQDLVYLLKENDFRIGVSLDGPQHVHSINRFKANQESSYPATIAGLELLQKNEVSVSIIVTVSKPTLRYASQVLRYLTEKNLHSISYSPVFDSYLSDGISISNEEWTSYLISVFNTWWDIGNPEIRIRELDEVIAWMSGVSINCCSSTGGCSHWLSVENNGDVYPCERYNKTTLLGNITQNSFESIVESEMFQSFVKRDNSIHPICQNCQFWKLCQNGCPNMRVVDSCLSINGLYGFCGQRKTLYHYIQDRFTSILEKEGGEIK